VDYYNSDNDGCVCCSTARVDQLNITDADGLALTNDSSLPVNSSLVCLARSARLRSASGNYEASMLFTWTNINTGHVFSGNTVTLNEHGPFHYRCNIQIAFGEIRGTTRQLCNTSRQITGKAIASGRQLQVTCYIQDGQKVGHYHVIKKIVLSCIKRANEIRFICQTVLSNTIIFHLVLNILCVTYRHTL